MWPSPLCLSFHICKMKWYAYLLELWGSGELRYVRVKCLKLCFVHRKRSYVLASFIIEALLRCPTLYICLLLWINMISKQLYDFVKWFAGPTLYPLWYPTHSDFLEPPKLNSLMNQFSFPSNLFTKLYQDSRKTIVQSKDHWTGTEGTSHPSSTTNLLWVSR